MFNRHTLCIAFFLALICLLTGCWSAPALVVPAGLIKQVMVRLVLPVAATAGEEVGKQVGKQVVKIISDGSIADRYLLAAVLRGGIHQDGAPEGVPVLIVLDTKNERFYCWELTEAVEKITVTNVGKTTADVFPKKPNEPFRVVIWCRPDPQTEPRITFDLSKSIPINIENLHRL